MHEIQKKLIKLSQKKDISNMTLRQIGRLIGEEHPQKVKHHLNQLEKRGFFEYGKKSDANKKLKFLNVPILGSASCGEATIFADECLEGYLKISSKLLKKKENIFSIRARGSSMNRANVKGNTIDDGDFVIIDSSNRGPKSGDYVLSIIDDVANIKKFVFDKKNKQIILLSESTEDLPPIYVHLKDFPKYVVSGKVIQVIKKPDLKWL